MNIVKSNGRLQACFSPKEIATLLINSFFLKLFSNKKLKNETYDSTEVSNYIKKLANESIDSLEYELYTAILDLYYQFERNCQFCFNLQDSFNLTKDKVLNLDDLYSHRVDPPDVIVKYDGMDHDFELKRYRGTMTFDDLYSFVRRKIILHYSGMSNYLVILQLEHGTEIDLDIFRKLHQELIKEKNQPGYIGFSFNHNNKEIILIRVLPDLNKHVRPYDGENDLFTDLLHADEA